MFIYKQTIIQLGLTPDKVGLLFVATALPYAIIAPLSGKLADATVSLFIIGTH